MRKWFEQIEDGLFLKSRSMPSPWGPVLRVVRYPAALIRDWLHGEISVRAMSLAYTTLLSIVPLLALSFSILKGLGARGDLRFLLHQFFRPLGNASAQLTESVMQFVANMRADLLGSIGLAFLVYTAVTTIQKVEASFNFVWRVARPRSFARRFTEYLTVMILGPILLAVALGLMGSAEDTAFARFASEIVPLAWLARAAGQLLPYLLVTGVFIAMYAFVPNTRVQIRAAVVGGLAAGVIWALVGEVFTSFIVYSSSLVAVYTGFAIVLTTLIWVYLSWLILLFGAQLAFYLQFPQYLRHGQGAVELVGHDRELVALSIMYLIANDYAAGAAGWSANRLAAQLDAPSIAVEPVIACLEKAGLLLATEEDFFVPGRDPANIAVFDILEAVRLAPAGRWPVAIHAIAPARELMAEVEHAVRSPSARSLKQWIGT